MVIKPKPTTIEIPIVAILVNKLTETMLAADLLPLEPDDELEEEERRRKKIQIQSQKSIEKCRF